MNNDNRGFTLVELIVSIAILGVIAVAAAGFLLAGTRSYTNVNYSVRLQYESQLAMRQIENQVINCNSGLAWDSNTSTLYVADKGDSGSPLYVFKFDNTKNQLLFGSGSTVSVPTPNKIMAEHMTGFIVSAIPDVNSQSDSVNIKIQMEMGGKEYQATQTIALRNKPYYYTSWSSLQTKLG
jgi:prepilin-type N-terminal cleavage/methylation domain-containing protein